MSFTIDVNGSKAVMARLDRTIKAVGSPKKALTETGEFLIQEFKDNFPSEGSRLGSPWKKLKADTIREKQRLGYGSAGILVRTGKMMNAFEKEVSSFMVRVSNPTKYFKYHQLGTEFLPQRKMIVASEKLKGKIYEIFNLFIRNSIK